MEILTPPHNDKPKTFLCNVCLRYLPEEKRAREGKKIRKHCTMCKAALARYYLIRSVIKKVLKDRIPEKELIDILEEEKKKFIERRRTMYS
jgi:CRISPR/Cas system-associated protein Cas10 (large subunit of type III CRISPR-Cas system)